LAGESTEDFDVQVRPWLFLPFGMAPAVVIGYVMIAVADELVRAGVPLGPVSVLVAAAFMPATLVFLWAPLVDAVGRRQRWVLAGVLLLCIAAAGMALAPRTTSAVSLLLSLSALAGVGYSLVSAAQKGLAVSLFTPARRVAAAGWTGAGSGIGLALGGGLLAVSAQLPAFGMALLLVAVTALPVVASLAVLERHLAPRPQETVALRVIAQETGRLFGTAPGLLALAICVLPFGSSAAALMVGALGPDFQASASFVGAWAGTAKSLAFAAGALLGAKLWERIGTMPGLLVAGGGLVALALLVLAGPKTSSGYAAMVSGYGFLQGASLSAIMGIVLQTVEQRAASTQAAVLVAAGNLNNVYLPPVAGRVHDAGGIEALLLADAAIGVCGLLLLLVCARLLGLQLWRIDRPPG
jgi:MFS family permease